MGLETQGSEQNNKFLDKVYDDIKSNAKDYTITDGDSIYAIAKNNSINADDLVMLNSLLQKEFKVRGKNIIIRKGDTISIPKDIELFNTNISKLKEIKEILNINQELTKNDLETLKLNSNLYPSRVQSIGLPKILNGFVKSQEAEIDPRLPRIVDSSRETNVSCANLIRTLMAQSINIANAKTDEKAFLKKQNLDAWILPTELKAIGYDQRFKDLMSLFDKDKIGQVDPIAEQKGYDNRVIQLNNYIEKNGVPGSLVPYYFKFSKFKGVVADYNRKRPEGDKHYNTHQSMFAGNADMKFQAYEIKDYSVPGKISNFGGDKEKINKEIKDLSSELESAKASALKTKALLLKSTDLNENEDIKKADRYLSKGLSVATGGNQAKIDELKIIILSNLSQDGIKSQVEKALKRKITDADLERILALKKIYNSTYNSVLAINQNLSKNTQVQDVSGKVKSNAAIIANINKYNEALEKIKNNEASIKDLKEKLKIERKLTLVDYIANFIESRLDYGPSAFTPESRAKVIEGILKYNSMIHIKVNGQKILLDRESRNYQKGLSTIFVKPDTKIEISGPLMIDGEHQMNSGDDDRKEKMNARTRFFFEFITPGTYLPTELLEPGKDSSLRKTEFGKPSDKFELKGVYDVRRGETVEKALKEKIVIFEKLDPKDPKFTQKLNYIYGLQIKALKIAGFMQDEQNLNPGAFKINRTIPYYDLANIEKVFSAYIIDKKKILGETGEKLKDIKQFASVNVFPGDTEYHVFNRLISSIKGVDTKKYPHIEEIFALNYLQQKNLTKELLNGFYDKNGHIVSGKKLVISFAKLEKILQNMSGESFMLAPKIKNIDEFVINQVTGVEQNRNLLKNIMYREIYGGQKGTYFTDIIGRTLGEPLDNTYMMKNKKITTKRIIQAFNNSDIIMQTEYKGQSVGDFQVRFMFLQSGWKEWLNKDTMNKALDMLENKNIKNKISSFSESEQEQIQEDLKIVDDLKILVNKKNPSKDDFENMYWTLRKIIRITNGDNSNYVGKVISSVFMESKLNNHFEKLAGMMNSSGEKIDSNISSEEMKKYEKMVIHINNQGERHAFYSFVENYLLRIMNEGMNLNIQTQDVYSKSVEGGVKGQIDYNGEIFINHLKTYINQLNNLKLSPEQEAIKIIINKLYIDLGKTKGIQEFMNTLYSFMKNQNIKKFLEEKQLSTSIIPESNEFRASAFQKSVFTYLLKGVDV
ncbi:MAG: hypothetical protein PHG82_03150 [Candidatus Gracilibacteria bacterium]|nr:hypothetical protein [Candidatus Gracilibacteria bacterium]